MRSSPPAGIASRPLRTRLRRACSICAGSTLTLQRSSASEMLEVDVLAERALEKLLEAADDLVQVDDLRVGDVAAAEDQKLTRQRRAPLGGGADLGEVRLHRAVLGKLLGNERRVVEDHGEQVVEVVSDAAGELADRLHPAGAVERRLQACLALRRRSPGGDVAQGADDDLVAAPSGPERHLDLDGDHRAVFALDAPSPPARAAARGRCRPGRRRGARRSAPRHRPTISSPGLAPRSVDSVRSKRRFAAVFAKMTRRSRVEQEDRVRRRVQHHLPAQAR